jgi:hypothetical protein
MHPLLMCMSALLTGHLAIRIIELVALKPSTKLVVVVVVHLGLPVNRVRRRQGGWQGSIVMLKWRKQGLGARGTAEGFF